MVQEEIAPIGIIEQDNLEIKELGGWTKDAIYRLSFWETEFAPNLRAEDLQTPDLLGYIIIKLDGGVLVHGGRRFVREKWYVFEGVFRKNKRDNNYIPRITTYNVAVGSKVHPIQGVLYCQQNGINKCCAHVALRSILSRVLPEEDISYKRLNEIIVANTSGTLYYPGDGLSVPQMQAVLNTLHIPYFDRDYLSLRQSPDGSGDKFRFPYQSYIYSGIETGYGAILNFRVGKNAQTSMIDHAIPLFGHTFNKDTWVADADASYFELTKDVRYIRSDSWTGNFIAHDDNHGCNYCIPRMQLPGERIDYVCAIHERGAVLNPMLAEVTTLNILSDYIKYVDTANIWNEELCKILTAGKVRDHLQSFVLRTISIDKEEYLKSLKAQDGQGNLEDAQVLQFLQAIDALRKLIIVELSLPQLFPANKHKIGDFVFDASVDVGDNINAVLLNAFLFARLPGRYFFTRRFEPTLPNTIMFPSKLVDHVPLVSL